MRSWSANCQTINSVKCRAPATHVVEHPACRQRSNNLRVMYAESATIGAQEDRRNIAPTRRSLFAPTRRSLLAPTRHSLLAPTGAACLHRPGAACLHRPGAASSHRPGAACSHRPGAACLHRPGAASSHRPGVSLLAPLCATPCQAHSRAIDVRGDPGNQ